MANGALFIGWGDVVRGRERQSLEVFNEAVQFFGGLQQQGDIQSFDVVGLEAHGGDLNGFFLLRGDRDRLNQLRYSDEFVRIINRGSAVVNNIGVVSAFTGDELGGLFANYQNDTADLTQ